MKKYIFILIIFIFYNSNAQTGFEKILLADKNDSQKILEAYFSPKIKGYLNNLNSGWFHTAKAHKPFGFDFSINISNAIIPSNQKFFNLTGLSSVNKTLGGVSGATATGNNNNNNNNNPVLINTNINGQNVTASFDLPGGTKGILFNNSTSIPIAQLSIGLPRKFGVMIRLVPEMKFNNSNEALSIFGIGFKKEITDWFGKTENLPLHISLLAAYNKMNVIYDIENQSAPIGNNSGIESLNGFSEFNLNTFTFKAIASIDWPKINVFGGLGYNTGNSNFIMKGTFKGHYKGAINPESKNLGIPEFSNYQLNGVSATIGTKINLHFLKVFGSYSLQEYNTLNLGIALSIK